MLSAPEQIKQNQEPDPGFSQDRDAFERNCLILVNRTHPFSFETITREFSLCPAVRYDGTECFAEKNTLNAYYALEEMLRGKGIRIGIDSAYRSIGQQQEIADAFCAKYGRDYAASVVAGPGCSEHHTGLAIDLVLEIDGVWITENAALEKCSGHFAVIHPMLADHGFILRYPAGKEQITGFPYEPWHIRYVGTKAACTLRQNGLTLEEYLASPEERNTEC